MTRLGLSLLLLLAGCSAQPAGNATPRTAPDVPAQSGAPLDPAIVPAAVFADVRPVGAPGAPYQTAPYAVEKMLGSGIMAGGAPTPTPNPPEVLAGGTTYSGKLAWADPKYGPLYLALREPRGTRVLVCGPADCVEMTSNDYGPVYSLWKQGRIADVAVASWERICGVSRRFGLCPGSIQILSRPRFELPATSTKEGP